MFKRVARIVAIAIAAVAAFGVGLLVLAQVAPGAYRWLPNRIFETGGLVFVESPEVYTRQRLVNDRYEQDAWLRGKLADIDDAVLIERRERSSVAGVLSLGGDTGDGKDLLPDAKPPASGAPPPPASTDLPFGPKFNLQSSLRDKIRQQILENALDDRHDLSGNTVYGLKFDTAVIPGWNTWKSPTVVVKLAPTEIDDLRDRADEAAPLYTRAPYLDNLTNMVELRDPVNEMNRHFDRWRRNLERRLNDYKDDLAFACDLPDEGADEISFGFSEFLTALTTAAGQGRTVAKDAGSPAGSPAATDVAEELRQRGLCGTAPGLPACPASGDRKTYADWFDATPLCEIVEPPTPTGTFSVRASQYVTDTLFPAMLPQAPKLNEAIQFKLRVPPRNVDYQEQVLGWLRNRARTMCANFNTALKPEFFEDRRNATYFTRDAGLKDPLPQTTPVSPHAFDPGTAPRRVSSFISTLATQQESSPLALLPGPWGNLFQVQFSVLPPRGAMCRGAAIDLRLLEREVGVMIIDGESRDRAFQVLPGAGWSIIRCDAEPCTEEDVTVWVQRAGAPADDTIAEIFDRDTLDALIRETSPEVLAGEDPGPAPGPAESPGGKSACTSTKGGVELQFGKLFPNDDWTFYGDTRLPEGANFPELACISGRAFQLKAGAYRFLQRMAAIDSYTYAAFPRGDVAGVVSETTRAAGVSLDAPLPNAGGAKLSTDLAAQSDVSEVEAVPSMVNFATGGGQEAFDFGWAIVKDGRKEPMLASQVVLLSVPAYLEEITLDVWLGFVDVDLTSEGSGSGNLLPEMSDTLASRKIESFTESNDPITMRLRVPPDYTALDGIVIGNDILSGPQIQVRGLKESCHRMSPNRDFSIAIAGDRLWRSTVVTLDGVKADRIEVMPDMGGILAIFTAPRAPEGKTPPPNAVYLPGWSGPRTLTVWTSEGSDDVEIATCGTEMSQAEK